MKGRFDINQKAASNLQMYNQCPFTDAIPRNNMTKSRPRQDSCGIPQCNQSLARLLTPKEQHFDVMISTLSVDQEKLANSTACIHNI